MNMDVMATTAASLYFLGVFMYYWHIMTVLTLTEHEGYNGFRVMLLSIIWPYNVVEIILRNIFNKDDEDE